MLALACRGLCSTLGALVTRSRVVKSVLHNFLGTYTSRYSDYRGYWLHGQLPQDGGTRKLDLLGTASAGGTPESEAYRLAIRRFGEQVIKSTLTMEVVRKATLQVDTGSEVVQGWHGNRRDVGRMVRFVARAEMHTGRVFETEQKVFVAAHDPEKERRRSEEDWGT